jgi:hypothetical protein
MDKKQSEKGILGSVAVDSQTGMEQYNVPKEPTTAPQVGDAPDASVRDNFRTPNYGENTGAAESQNLAGVPDEFLHLFEHDPSEAIVYQATRHPIGVFAIFAMGGVAALLVILGYSFLIADPSFFSSLGMSSGNVSAVGALITLVLLVLVVGISLLAAHVYKKSRLILTNQKVVFIQYHSLIAREISQLNIGEVEDVNVSQPTLFDRIFKTGKVTIETAGEQNNYVLTQVEKPYEFARLTIQMHEGSIAEYGN